MQLTNSVAPCKGNRLINSSKCNISTTNSRVSVFSSKNLGIKNRQETANERKVGGSNPPERIRLSANQAVGDLEARKRRGESEPGASTVAERAGMAVEAVVAEVVAVEEGTDNC